MADCRSKLKKEFSKVDEDYINDVVSNFEEALTKYPDSQGYRNASEDLINDMVANLSNKRIQARLNVIRSASNLSFYNSARAKGLAIDQAIGAKLRGGNALIEGNRNSTDAKVSANTGILLTSLVGQLRRADLLEIAQRGELDSQIEEAMVRISKNQNMEGLPDAAVRVARVYHNINKMRLDMLQSSGANIRNLDTFVMNQSHNSDSIFRAGVKEWSRDILPLLDMEKTFGNSANSDEFVSQFLNSAFKDITEGKFEFNAFREDDLGLSTKSKFNQITFKSRKIHFKPGSLVKYNEKYGNGKTILENITAGSYKDGRNAAVISDWGVNPEKALDQDIKTARKILQKDMQGLEGDELLGAQKELDKLSSNERLIKATLSQIQGRLNSAVQNKATSLGDSIGALEQMSKLGSVLLASVTDIPTASTIVSATTGKNLLQSYGDIVADAARFITNKEDRKRFGEYMGLFFDEVNGDIHKRFGGQGMDGNRAGTMTRMANSFMRLTGLTNFTESMKAATVTVFSRELADSSSKSFDQLNPRLRASLGLFNIDKNDWNIIRKNIVKTKRGNIIPVEGLEGSLKQKLAAYYVDHAELGVPTPNARVKVLLNQGLEDNTAAGAAIRMISRFKQHPMTIMANVVPRVALSNPEKSGVKLTDLARGQGDMQNFVGLVLGTTVFGYMGMVATDLAKGESPSDPANLDVWAKAFVRGGSAGLMGDFMFAEYDKQYRSLASDLLGPTIGGTGTQVAEIFAKAVRGKDVSRQLINTTLRQIPGQNHFLLRGALDTLVFDQINESLNPGYKLRKKRRLREQNKDILF